MGNGKNKTDLFLSNLAVHKKTKGNVYKEKPVFCENGKSLIISSGKSCHLYNTATGNHTKELFQCADDIIALQLHPIEPSFIIAITENGEVSVFNLKTNEIEYTIKLSLSAKILKKQNPPKFTIEEEQEDESDHVIDWESQPLDSLEHRKFIYAEVRAFQNSSTDIYVWASWSLNDEVKSHFSVFTFGKGKHIGLLNLRKTGLKKCYSNFAVGTVEGIDLFVGLSTDFVHLARFDIKKTNVYKKHFVGMDLTPTCLALHPSECMFATGDSRGRIILWRNIFDNNPLREIYHWHTLGVHDLFFSKFGNYLFSGGEENVLVKWSLASNSKDFLPRLSSTVHHISGSSDASLLSLSTLDNKILIIDFNFKNVSTIQHFSRWSVMKSENKVDIFTIDPRSNCLVLNGKTGHIQFLSLNEEGKFIYTFDVTNRNFITSDSDAVIENTEVTHAKFSKCGKWLTTAECRSESGVCKESRLKFWMYCEKEKSYALNTNVELPHEASRIHSLEVSPDGKVATSGADKKFRVWSLFECEQAVGSKEIWALSHVSKYRNLPCFAIDFSSDASLIAVSFGPVLTVWDAETCTLKCSLCAPRNKEDVKYCKFGNRELSHLVVTGTESSVSCWNVITLSMVWTVPLKLSILISDPFSIYMAAFSKGESLIVFNPASPSPDFTARKICHDSVVAAQCAIGETGKLCLYFLSCNQELFCLDDDDKPELAISNKVPTTRITPYGSQLAEIRNRTDGDRRRIVVDQSNNQYVLSLLDSPAHTLPNPSLLCSEVLKSLLARPADREPRGSSLKQTKKEDLLVADKPATGKVEVVTDTIEKKMLEFVETTFPCSEPYEPFEFSESSELSEPSDLESD